MDTLATPLTTMALLACAYGTHEKPKQEIKTVKNVDEVLKIALTKNLKRVTR